MTRPVRLAAVMTATMTSAGSVAPIAAARRLTPLRRVTETEQFLKDRSQHRWCTFCGKCQAEVAVLIAGPMLGNEVQFICDECVELAMGIVTNDKIKNACRTEPATYPLGHA